MAREYGAEEKLAYVEEYENSGMSVSGRRNDVLTSTLSTF